MYDLGMYDYAAYNECGYKREDRVERNACNWTRL